MFKQSQALFESGNSDTIIGGDAYFQGTITTKGSILVDGRVEGSVFDAKTVSVGKTGKVKGDISCESCCVGGDVCGNIVALENIEVLAGAHIRGDIKTKRILMEDGSVFNGRCDMETQRAQNDGQPESEENDKERQK